jgi:putative transcriptional regulator
LELFCYDGFRQLSGEDFMSFGTRLKALRTAAKLTQQQLGDRVGLHREAIARLESGAHVPNWNTVLKFAAVLGVQCTAFQDADDGAAKPAKTVKKRAAKK